VLEPSDWLRLTGLSFPCLVGLTDREQLQAQRLDLEIALCLNLDGAAGGDLSASVDYRAVIEQVKFLAQEGRWRLLESLASALAAHLLRPPARDEGRIAIAGARVRLGKPEVFGGNPAPSIEIQRETAWLESRARFRDCGGVRAFVLQESRQTGAYHVDLTAAEHWTVAQGMHAMILAGHVDCEGRKSPGDRLLPGSQVTARGPAGARLLLVSSSITRSDT
jgi:FolB domain-containing protein